MQVGTPKYSDLIYDVGLHKGEDAEFYLRKGFRVVGFEADPDLAVFCRNRLKEFLDRGQLTIVEGAIVDPESIEGGHQRARFYQNHDISVWGTVCADWSERNTKLGSPSTVIEVDAIHFADAIREHGVPYFMKIDIEGCDKFCVSALRDFEARPSYISIESSKTSFGDIEREIDWLIELGYSSFQAVEQSGIPASQSPPLLPREGNYVAQRFEFGSSGLFGAELEGKWRSRREILRQYRFIHLGYFLLGDNGIMNGWRFWGAAKLRSWVLSALGRFTPGAVQGWYDTHARL
jgi:FkbM family methyltransferase